MIPKDPQTIDHTERCVHGTRPPCSCACPANLNLREFMRKISRGNFNSAYRILADELLFPEIAIRLCGGVCAGACAENLDILALERTCIDSAVRKTPLKFSVTPKEQRIAIIGAGISGLACTLHLASRGFPVTVFDCGSEIGGTLGQVMDQRIYLDEFALQFKYAPYNFQSGVTIENPDALAEFDAVYVATGKDGASFGLLDSWNSQSMATARKGWFLGGELTGVGKFEALAQGRVASTSMEKYLMMSGSMAGTPEHFLQKECLFEAKNSGASSIPHENGFTRETAMAEAGRCRHCDCTLCFDACAFMQSMQAYPQKLASMSLSATRSTIGLQDSQTTNARMVASCSACGHCGSVCPHGVSMEPLFLASKQALYERGKFPPAMHAYYLDDMANANEANYLVQLPEGQSRARYLFFPGCQATESGAEHVKAAYDYLLDHFPDTAVMLGCCGIPALWAGHAQLFEKTLAQLRGDWENLGKPIMVLMCATCMKTFREHLPEIPCVSLYELLAQGPLPESARKAEDKAAVFDPCASRDFPEMQEAVRTLAQRLGVKLEELEHSRDKARCCGIGGHIYPANQKVALEMTAASARQSKVPYITYCENCRNVFLLEGKENRHILDDVFGIEPLARPPHIGELQLNRTALRYALEGTTIDAKPKETIQVHIADALYEKMDRALISAQEIRETIEACERTGRRLWDEDQQSYSGYLKVGHITHWVQYKKLEDGSFELVNTYRHKLEIGAAT